MSDQYAYPARSRLAHPEIVEDLGALPHDLTPAATPAPPHPHPPHRPETPPPWMSVLPGIRCEASPAGRPRRRRLRPWTPRMRPPEVTRR